MKRDHAIMVVVTALMATGLIMVASTSASLDHAVLSTSFLQTSLGRQSMFVVIGLLTMAAVSRLAAPILSGPKLCQWVAYLAFAVSVASLIALWLPGVADPQRGSHRWLRLPFGGLSFQPSEFAKPAIVVLLAWILTQWKPGPRSLLKVFLPSAFLLGTSVVLVGKEDLGTAAVVGTVGAFTLFVAGCRWLHMAGLAGVGACAFVGLVFCAPYRLTRIVAYGDFWAHAQGSGYQPVQSLVTIASGGWFGAGLGSGVQKYGYLPESHSDFIFAALCEEAGFCGGAMVIALFGTLIWLGFRTIRAAPSPFEQALAGGLTALVGVQATLNLAVVTALTPTTGISLPWVSAGGSGLVAFCLAAGVLAAIARRDRDSVSLWALREGGEQHRAEEEAQWARAGAAGGG